MSITMPKAANPIKVGDFTQYEEALYKGTLSYEDYMHIFEESRKHSLNYYEDMKTHGKPVRPYVAGCAVGGSTAAKIAGISDYSGPAGVAAEYFSIAKSKPSGEASMPLLVGHLYESGARDLFGHLHKELKVMPCYIQYTNPNWPHCLANVDGLVVEKDEKGKERLGVYEGKTLYNTRGEHGETFIKVGAVPDDYMYQIQFYMEILNLDFCWINVIWGITDGQTRAFRVERDRELGCEICQQCEDFANYIDKGIMPTNESVANMKARLADIKLLYPTGDSRIPAAKLSKKTIICFEEAQRKQEKINALEASIEPDLKLITDTEEKIKSVKKEIEILKKEQTESLVPVAEEMKDCTVGSVTDADGNVYTLLFPEEHGFSKDAKAMKALEESYPEAYKFLANYKPKERKFSYTVEFAGK